MKIDIGIYYGPIDLLVYLVRKKEVDIFDIPIAQVAEEYLDYIRRIEREDLEDAADFLLMAAILVRLKVRSLLPRTPEDEEETKPITLMQIIEEYKKYKEIARYFGEMETQSSKQFPRFAKVEPTTVLEEGDLTSLILAFKSFKPSEKEAVLIKRQLIPIERVIEDLTQVLEKNEKINFLKFLQEKKNTSIAVSYFFGMLQTVKEGLAGVEQQETFGEIYLYKRTQEG
uniref:Segregation and condensation protein A n=1 Tax=candidate division WOR-3 bacterium TaxID=2052148 RepID=A0A7V1EI53_UNCW3